MPTPQLDKTLEDEKYTLLRMQNWDWCMCKNGKPCIDSEVNINNKLEQAYNLGITTTIDRIEGIIGADESLDDEFYDTECERNYLRTQQRQALSTLKQELLTNKGK